MERHWRQKYRESSHFYTTLLIADHIIITGLVIGLVLALR